MSMISAAHGEAVLRVASVRLVDGLLAELVDAGREVGHQAMASGATLRSGSRWAWALLIVWVVGILGDALTTLVMMRTGRFEEANVAAATMMGLVGVGGWVLLSSLLCAAIAALSLARPRSAYAGAAAATALVICAGKLYATVGNATLWITSAT